MRVAVVGAKNIKQIAKKCEWEGCQKNHYDGIEKYPMKEVGILERGEYVGEWIEPFCIMLPSYAFRKDFSHGVKEGENKKLTSGRFKDENDDKIEITSCKEHYNTQNHHVIPTAVMEGEDFAKLKHNLNLMGWNINNGLLNGICLPYFKEDYIWHNLQPHRGSHPKDYTKEVKNYLSKLDEICVDFCEMSEDGGEIDQETLLSEINYAVTDMRNSILDWELKIHKTKTLKTWKDVSATISTTSYEVNKIKKTVPVLPVPKGREYFELIIE